MSRLFEYLRALDRQIEHPAAAKPSGSNGIQHDDDAGQILSILHLAQSGDPAAEESTNFAVAEVTLVAEDRLACHAEPSSPAAHRYRLLRVRLREMRKVRNLKTVLITSALPQDGKTTVLMNIATALRQQARDSVLVVDGDLHRSSLSGRFSPRSIGLAECVKSSVDPSSVIKHLQPLDWHFLPAGTPSENASELLQSDAAASIIHRLSSCFDWVLIDSPPVAPLADAVSLARHVDGTLFVIKADVTPFKAVEQAVSLIGRKRVIGAVLNGTQETDRLYDRYSGYYGRDDAKRQSAAPPVHTPPTDGGGGLTQKIIPRELHLPA